MAIGPFEPYAPAGVYTSVNTEQNLANVSVGLRIPTIIGVGQEELEQLNLELVRGSSSTVDQQIVNEDVSLSWVVSDVNPSNPILGAQDGTLVRFRVRNSPIVDGQGFGKITNDVRSLAVTVNGTPVAVGAVRGSLGEVVLQVPPAVGDVVRCTYFFHRGDTLFTDDVSDQVTSDVASLTTPGFAPFDIVSGSSDTLKLKVNGGSERTVLLTPAPSLRSTLTVAGVDGNGGVTYQAVTAGVAGNSIRVRHVVSGTNTPLSVSVSSLDITVNVATGAGGLATSTATDVAGAVAGYGAAAALVTPTATGTGASVVGAASYTALVGGLDGGSVASLKTQIDAAAISGLTTASFTGPEGRTHLQLVASVSLELTDGNVNGVLGFQNGTKTNRNKAFTVFQRPIVDGTGGGLTNTDPSKVVVKVNGLQQIPTSVDGKNGVVTLAFPPAPNSVVTIEYYANTWQDTFDYLPNTNVSNVIRAGISANRNDYIQGADFVVSNPSSDVSVIHWGSSFEVTSTVNTPGAELFDSTQIVPTLVDDKLYMAECSRYINSAVIPAVASATEFLLPEIPTLGNGRDTPLGSTLFNSVANSRVGLVSSRPDLIEVRTGRDLSDAMGRAAVKVVAVDSLTRKITLQQPVPPDHLAFATFWYSRLEDDTYTLTCKTAGPVGSGQYEVYSANLNGNVYQVKFRGKGGGLSDTVQWPRGSETIPDAFHFGGIPVSEVVRVTFGQAAATGAKYTNKGPAPYNFYTPYSASWRTVLNGSPAVVTNLATASRAYLLSAPVAVTGGNITVTSGAESLELTIDGEFVSVTLPTGAQTPAALATAINSAIDAIPAFTATTPNRLCVVIPAAGNKTYFVIRSYSTPGALPGGFDADSKVEIRQGTAEATLGFTTFQSQVGTPGAVNKPATLLGTRAGDFVWTSGVNNTLKVRLNGVDYTVTIQTSSVSPAAVISDINAVIPSSQGAASVGTLGNLDQIRITSATNGDNSSVVILDGNANSTLGFTQGDYAGQTRVTATEVANRLMDTVNFAVSSWSGAPSVNSSGAVAYPVTVNGQSYVTIASLTVGATSSVVFADGSNSAFNALSGTGITPGSDGDNGAAAADIFTVTSSNAVGSSGVGTPGQTYTDARTGLRFTVLPSTDGAYTSGWFELEVSPTFDVTPSVPRYAIPGIELIVSNTVNVGLNDSGAVQTFNPAGVEPRTGDFYFISYRYLKQDFGTKLYRTLKAIENDFGKVSAENRVSLGAYLASNNGAVLVMIKQVLKVPNTNQASARSFTDAIEELAKPLPGNIKPDILVPLSTDSSVYSFLTNHCETMSGTRNQKERMGFIGFASGTIPTTAQTITRNLQSARIVAFYPDSGVITLEDELGNIFETLVDGTFFAAAVSGAVVNPLYDVATPYTHRRVQGFTRIPRILDAVEANQTAVAGITVLEDLDPTIRIRQGLTTDMSSILTRLPTVVQIADHVEQSTRGTLDPFVGTKYLASRTTEVETSLTAMYQQLLKQEIVGGFAGISAKVSPASADTMDIESYFAPVFPLLYLLSQHNLRSRVS